MLVIDCGCEDPVALEPLSGEPVETRLDSWKEIAAYFRRDITTVQRWEKTERMPVHRHRHGKHGSVYAVAGELERWRQSRSGERERPKHWRMAAAAITVVVLLGAGLTVARYLGSSREPIIAHAGEASPQAYADYAQGQIELERSYTRTDIARGQRYFEDAIRTSPGFAPAYVGLAEAYSELGSNYIGGRPQEFRQKALASVRQALQLDPDLVDGHILLAGLDQERWNWSQSEAEYRRALALRPNNADAQAGFAWWLLGQGRTEEALRWARASRALDSVAVSNTAIGTLLYMARRYGEAERELQGAVAVQPDEPVGLWDLGIVLQRVRPAEAIPVLLKSAAGAQGSPGVTGTLISAYARAGQRAAALALLRDLQRRQSREYVPASAFVYAYLGLGDREQAMNWLGKACDEHSSILQFLKVNPDFDSLRGDPRFRLLTRRVGLG